MYHFRVPQFFQSNRTIHHYVVNIIINFWVKLQHFRTILKYIYMGIHECFMQFYKIGTALPYI